MIVGPAGSGPAGSLAAVEETPAGSLAAVEETTGPSGAAPPTRARRAWDEPARAGEGSGARGAETPSGAPAIGGRWAVAAARAVARHPSLWPTAVRQALVLAAPGWWRRRPFLPLPAPDYLRFRLQTAYGGAGDRAPDPADVVTYLHWCRHIE